MTAEISPKGVKTPIQHTSSLSAASSAEHAASTAAIANTLGGLTGGVGVSLLGLLGACTGASAR